MSAVVVECASVERLEPWIALEKVGIATDGRKRTCSCTYQVVLEVLDRYRLPVPVPVPVPVGTVFHAEISAILPHT